MKDIRIGDMVAPHTRLRFDELGKGLVVGISPLGISVVFLKRGTAFDLREFKREHLVASKGAGNERVRLNRTVGQYKKLTSLIEIV